MAFPTAVERAQREIHLQMATDAILDAFKNREVPVSALAEGRIVMVASDLYEGFCFGCEDAGVPAPPYVDVHLFEEALRRVAERGRQ